MAVAVKNPPVVPGTSPLDRMAVVSLVGAGYVLVSLGVVCGALPWLWATYTGLTGVGGLVILGLIMLAVATGLAILGVRLYGPSRPIGSRAGIAAGLVGFLLVLLLTRWASLWLEYWVYVNHWLGDSPNVGLAITAVIGVALLGGLIYAFFRPEVEAWLVRIEGQGWFSAAAYKGQQGQRVRRGTILGILLIAGSGIFTMNNNGFLQRLPARWALNIPFTGAVAVENAGDTTARGVELLQRLPAQDKDQLQVVAPGASGFKDGAVVTQAAYRNALRAVINAGRKVALAGDDGQTREVQALDQAAKDWLNKQIEGKDVTEVVNIHGSSDPVVAAVGPAALATLPSPGLPAAVLRLNQYTLRTVNDQLRAGYVRVTDPGYAPFRRGEVVARSKFEEEAAKIADEDGKPKGAAPFAATGPVSYQSLTLLPALQYTLPLLLIAASLWLAWRVVNYPAFADFLIATEAELNKVSWTTRPRLIQDTIVVLVTTVLLALFLFAMDQTWRVVLSWKPIGVLQINQDQSEQKSAEQKPW